MDKLAKGLLIVLAIYLALMLMVRLASGITYDDAVYRAEVSFGKEFNDWAKTRQNLITAQHRSPLEKRQWEQVKRDWVVLQQTVDAHE